MQKKMLIISSDHTGHGHKSITEAICEKVHIDDNVKVEVVDGFSLGGKLLNGIGKSYGPITRFSENLWKLIWNMSALKAPLVNKLIESLIKKNFLKLMDEKKPDFILSVHPNFNGSILNILEKEKMDVPFYTLIADLVNIYPLWADRRADYILSPTEEAKEKCLQYGVPEEKIKVVGFPVRSKFFSESNSLESKEQRSPLTCLVMSGGEGTGNMNTIAENLLENFDCQVNIIAGRNQKLKANLEKSLLGRYGDKVQIYGFVTNIHELMLDADIAFTRGSPNVMFEAVAANTPLVITGALPGQEEDNPVFAERAGLGVICKDVQDIQQTIGGLLAHNHEKLNTIRQSQKAFINEHAAEDILRFLLHSRMSHQQAEVDLKVVNSFN
ncbi:glycosyltransferase [Radiobacillus kanasensis]|uniref:MGDG synthase family glycosyltransferase n=1 Tax=Radiobacillus kanasensis TaxID=2844358 RepID=UPI001E5AAAA2|nr:glycosyltransferase [Radiobacillus kanasensis]UFU00197.1 glycosyltransferase [Radiobacillus kanasensis]